MDKYYYLISQLPSLVFDKSSYMSKESFLDEAGKWMNARDVSLLSEVDFNNTELNGKLPSDIQSYQNYEKAFRLEVEAWRKARKSGLDYKPSLFPASMIKEGNPLEVEKKFLQTRWQFIDDMEKDHHFDLVFVMLYYLKLQILGRLMAFDKQKGIETFQKVSKVTL